MDQLKVVSGFASHVTSLIKKFYKPHTELDAKARESVTIKDCDDAVNIVKPVAEHGGTQTFNVFNGPVLIQEFPVKADTARVVGKNASRLKAKLQFPETERRQFVPLRWFRLDTAAAKQKGASPDKAIIEEIDPKPKPVFFADDLVHSKQEMVESLPFAKYYFVDVEVSRADDKVRSYRIVGYHGRDDEDDE